MSKEKVKDEFTGSYRSKASFLAPPHRLTRKGTETSSRGRGTHRQVTIRNSENRSLSTLCMSKLAILRARNWPREPELARSMQRGVKRSFL